MTQATQNADKWSVLAQAATVIEEAGNGQAVGKKITLNTANKFVDRDIVIPAPTVDVAAGKISTAEASVTPGSASMAATGFTAVPAGTTTDYYVTLSTTAGTAKSNATVETAGWVAADASAEQGGDGTAVAVSGDGEKLYLPVAGVSSEVTVTKAPTVAVAADTTKIKTDTTSAYTITITPSQTDAGRAYATAATTAVGMVNTTTNDWDEAAINATIPEAQTIHIKAGSIGVAAKDADVTAYTTTDTTAIVPSEGYLTIAEGYYPATKIALATIVADDANIVAGAYDEEKGGYANAQMLAGATAYDKDGKLNIGTIPTVTASVSTTDGQKVSVPAGYVAKAQEVSVANGSVKLGTTDKSGQNFNVVATADDQTITVSEGWLENQTITIKGASNLDAVASTVTATSANTAITTLTPVVDIDAGTVSFSDTAAISGTTTATTKTAGYSSVGQKTGEGSYTGTASITGTIAAYKGIYTLG